MATLTNGRRTFEDLSEDEAQAMADVWNDAAGTSEWEVLADPMQQGDGHTLVTHSSDWSEVECECGQRFGSAEAWQSHCEDPGRNNGDSLKEAARSVVETLTADPDTLRALGEHFLFGEVEPLAMLAHALGADDSAQQILCAWAVEDSCAEDHADELATWGIWAAGHDGWAISGPVLR